MTLSYNKADIELYYVSVDAFVAAVKKYYGGYTDPERDAKIAVNDNTVDVTYRTGMMYCEEANPIYVEDIKYVNHGADNVADAFGLSATDMSCYYSKSDAWTRDMGYVHGTGTFYARRFMQCYYETDFNTVETEKLCLDMYGQYGITGLYDPKIFSIPVWWDWTK